MFYKIPQTIKTNRVTFNYTPIHLCKLQPPDERISPFIRTIQDDFSMIKSSSSVVTSTPNPLVTKLLTDNVTALNR